MENTECYQCGGLGHFARECTNDSGYKRNSSNGDKYDDDYQEGADGNVHESVKENEVESTTLAKNTVMDDDVDIKDNLNGNIESEEKEAITYTLDEWKSQ